MKSLCLAILVAAAAVSPAASQSVRLDVSIDELEARARRDSTDPAAWYNLAVGRISRNQFDQADSLLERAVALDPQFAVAYFALGLVQDRNDRFWERLRRGGDSAIARELRRRQGLERKAFLIDPFVDIRLLGSVLRRGYVMLGAARAFEEMAQGNYAGAYERFERSLRDEARGRSLDSVPGIILWLHALAAARTEHYAEAIASAEALLRQSLKRERADSTRVLPLRTNEYRYMLAALHQRAGHRDDAVNGYQDVLTHDIGNYMAHVQLARMHEAARNWPDAIRERRQAVETNPEDHTLQFDLGAALARSGQWQPAEEALLQARQMQPRYARTWHVLGIVQQQLGKHGDARASLTHFVAIAPSRYTSQVTDAQQRLAQLP